MIGLYWGILFLTRFWTPFGLVHTLANKELDHICMDLTLHVHVVQITSMYEFKIIKLSIIQQCTM